MILFLFCCRIIKNNPTAYATIYSEKPRTRGEVVSWCVFVNKCLPENIISVFMSSLPEENEEKLSNNSKRVFLHQEKPYACYICSNEHKAFQCPIMNQASVTKRFTFVRDLGLCQNCLFKHGTAKCRSHFRCKTCNEKHHTLLHRQINSDSTNEPSTSSFNAHLLAGSNVLLATAMIPVYSNGRKIYLRALLDQGSIVNIITESATQLIQATKFASEHTIVSIGDSDSQTGVIKHKV